MIKAETTREPIVLKVSKLLSCRSELYYIMGYYQSNIISVQEIEINNEIFEYVTANLNTFYYLEIIPENCRVFDVTEEHSEYIKAYFKELLTKV